jgi:hypothetical protein
VLEELPRRAIEYENEDEHEKIKAVAELWEDFTARL